MTMSRSDIMIDENFDLNCWSYLKISGTVLFNLRTFLPYIEKKMKDFCRWNFFHHRNRMILGFLLG